MNIIILAAIALFGAFVLYLFNAARRMKNTPSVEANKKIINLDDRNFQPVTKNSVALVDFWAEWCMPCKMMAPVLNEIADEVDEKVKVCKVNVEHQKNLAARFAVRGIPTLLILKNGKEVKRFVGVKPKEFLKKEVISLV